MVVTRTRERFQGYFAMAGKPLSKQLLDFYKISWYILAVARIEC
jgi:hypothetical protein